MIQNLNSSKTAEIMSRYRPIAPKPDFPLNPICERPSVSQNLRKSPYLSHVWAHLQAKPTRTRKRGRTSLAPPTIKRLRTSQLLPLTPTPPCNINNINSSSLNNLSFLASTHGLTALPTLPLSALAALTTTSAEIPAQAQAQAQAHSNLVTLPLFPWPCKGDISIDFFNKEAEIPQERDFLQQIEEPVISNVIAPQPVRPVGSSISVGSISEDPNQTVGSVPKKREEVEEEVESEVLPAVVSDSNHKVRMANSAYKKMVGQPECSWLESMVRCDGSGSACKRIGGEVMLRFSDSGLPVSANGFSCWVRIEWESDDKKSSVDAFSDVMRLSCDSNDYLFAWKFHKRDGSIAFK